MTARQIIKSIPIKWRDAEIAVGYLQYAKPVVRIALHQNEDGKKVIVIHDDAIIPKK